MKTKTLVVIFFTTVSVALISCDWLFGKRSRVEKTKSIIGKWKLERIEDSGKNAKNEIGLLAFALTTKNSTPVTIEFKPDSTYGFFQNNKPLQNFGKYYVDSIVQTLFLKKYSSSKEDSTYALVIKNKTDSSLQLFSNKDSIEYNLIKQ